MSATFKVGEIAILQNCMLAGNEGKECQIVGPLELRLSIQEGEILAYRVETSAGFSGLARPHQLRKKQPPNQPSASARQVMLDCIRKAKQPAKVGA